MWTDIPIPSILYHNLDVHLPIGSFGEIIDPIQTTHSSAASFRIRSSPDLSTTGWALEVTPRHRHLPVIPGSSLEPDSFRCQMSSNVLDLGWQICVWSRLKQMGVEKPWSYANDQSPFVGPLMIQPGARLKVTVSGRASALWSPCSWHGIHILKPWLAMKTWQGDHGRTILGWFGIQYPSITFLYVMSRKLLISQFESVSLDSLNNIDGWVFKKTQDNCFILFYCMNSFVRVRIPSMNQQEIWQSLSNKIRWHCSRISINQLEFGDAF